MAMIHNVSSRQISSMGNTDSFYNPQPPAVPSPASNPHYGFYRQQSPRLHPASHIANSVPQPYYMQNREMEFLNAPVPNDYRLYPPSPPIQDMQMPTGASSMAPLPSQYQYPPAYMRSSLAPQDMLQPIDGLHRLPPPGNAASPMIPSSFTTRLPSPFGHPREVHPVTQRRVSTLPGIRKTAKRAHSCMVCGKVFARPSALQTHLYSHTGEKPFKCEHSGCGRSFSVVSNLRRHARVHKD